ncbi:MAG TPA: competence/damage-inducible protein A [Vicinamibacterales bacterium]|nr:competence/damage-inducible protein A [Vicinamibacterales bacterium]
MAGARDALTPDSRVIRTAEIVAVGTELLTPFRIDTNSLYLTQQLNDLGIDVRIKSVVGDDPAVMADRFRQALASADLVVTTGGLGPTSDDLTREMAAGVLGLELIEQPDLVQAIERRFERRGMRMPEANRRQAAVPRGAAVLPNPNGTAPGLWIETGDRVLLLLPGPPREMQPMFAREVAPRLAARTGLRRVFRRVLKVAGRAESQVEEIAEPIYSRLTRGDHPIETTILASPGLIELHLSGRGEDEARIERALDDGIRQLAAALGPPVFSTDGRSIEEVVAAALMERGLTLAAAESCTGGLVSGRLTDVPGSSAWFLGAVVAYANAIKMEALGVPQSLLAAHGAVSEPVGRAMAEGVRSAFHAGVGVGITGIAGPAGGTPEKPVGTVVIAVATAVETSVRTLHLAGDRSVIRQHSVVAALDAVRCAIGG